MAKNKATYLQFIKGSTGFIFTGVNITFAIVNKLEAEWLSGPWLFSSNCKVYLQDLVSLVEEMNNILT